METRSTESSRSTAGRHSLRVLGRVDEADLVREMTEVGVDPAGIGLMSPKGISRVVRLEGLSAWQANLLKQEMLSLGAEAAVHRGAIDCSACSSAVLLMGTEKHFRTLFEKLGRQPPTMRSLGEELREGLARYDRDRFTLSLGGRRAVLGERTWVMGVVNVSPDSFYDGGRYFSTEKAVEHGLRLAGEGADILDVGGESSRPGAAPVAAEEEQRRILPVIEALASRCPVSLSVDTFKAETARRALEAGAVMINDISGLRFDPAMAGVAASAGAALMVMHMQGEPRTMQDAPEYGSVMGEIVDALRSSVECAVAAGVDEGQILVDPGIGFGKRLKHNLHLLGHLSELRVLGRPVAVGPSRKSFIGALGGLPPEQRLEGTIAAVCLAVAAGAQVVRVHDVQEVRRALLVADALCRGKA